MCDPTPPPAPQPPPSKVRAILGISRVPFLLLPVTLIAAGAAASAYEGGFSWWRTLLALVGLVFAHIGVNAMNEASDRQTGIDLETEPTPFSGGSGTLPSGALEVRTAYVWALTAFGIAAAIGAFFLVDTGPVLWPILLVGGFSVLAYTHVLARIGLGEVLAGLGLGSLPILGTSLVQDGQLGPASWAASVPAFFMTLNLLLLNEFPDETADRHGGRRHLVILLGRKRAALFYKLGVYAVPVAIVTAVILGVLPSVTLFACLPTLLCIPGLRWAKTDPQSAVPIPALAGNVFWNLGTNAVLALTLLLATLYG